MTIATNPERVGISELWKWPSLRVGMMEGMRKPVNKATATENGNWNKMENQERDTLTVKSIHFILATHYTVFITSQATVIPWNSTRLRWSGKVDHSFDMSKSCQFLTQTPSDSP